MKKPITVVLLALSLGMVSAQTLKLKKGQEFNYVATVDGTVTQSMAGQEMTMKMNSFGQQQYTVEAKNGDNYTLLAKIITDSLVLTSPMMDSTFRPGAEVAEMTRYEISKLGVVLSKADARPETAKNNPAMSMGFDVKQTLPLIPFHNNKVAAGDTWTDNRTDSIDFMGGLLVISTQTNYTVAEQAKRNGVNCLVLKVTADIANEGSTSMQGMEFFMEGTGKMAGNIYLDAKTGFLIDEELVTENQINLALTGQQAMVIPISQKMTSKRTLKK